MIGIREFFVSSASDTIALLIGAAAFGAASNSLYAILLAEAADISPREKFVVLGSSILLLNAVGAAIGSFASRWAIRAADANTLLTFVGMASFIFAAYILLHPKGATGAPTAEQSTFVSTTSAIAPAALQQDLRAADITKRDRVGAHQSDPSARSRLVKVQSPMST